MTDPLRPDARPDAVLTLQVWPGLERPSSRTVSVHDGAGVYVTSYSVEHFPLAEAIGAVLAAGARRAIGGAG